MAISCVIGFSRFLLSLFTHPKHITKIYKDNDEHLNNSVKLTKLKIFSFSQFNILTYTHRIFCAFDTYTHMQMHIFRKCCYCCYYSWSQYILLLSFSLLPSSLCRSIEHSKSREKNKEYSYALNVELATTRMLRKE